MPKKAQVTFFVVLSAYLILIVGLFFWYNGYSASGIKTDVEKSIQFPAELAGVNNFFELCLRDAAEEALIIAGFQGGFAEPIAGMPKLETSFSDIQFWKFYESKLYSKSFKEIAAGRLGKYVADRVQGCALKTKEQSPFAEFGKEKSVKAMINKNDVTVEVKSRLSVKSGGIEAANENHRISIPVRLGYIMDSAEKIIDKQIRDVDKIDLTYLSSFDFEASSIMSDNEEILFKITDKKSLIDNEPYVFLFAEKYGLNETGNNYAPRMGYIGSITAKAGEPYSRKVEAIDINNDALKFSSSSDIFKISDNGLIQFMPSSEDIGPHFATITVEDSKGLKDEQVVRVEVV